MQTAPRHRTAPLALWRAAEAFLHLLHALFGAPEDVAREHTLSRAAYTLMLSWLRVGEALLRRLLVIEAAAFDHPAPSRARAPRQRQRKLMHFTPDNPQDWRVSFRCFSSSPADSGGSPEPRSGKGKGQRAPSDAFGVSSPARGGDKNRFFSAWPIAERYEALLRVFNAPHAYARRLARRLHANPRALETVLHQPEHFTDRVDDAEHITATARSAWRRDDSS